MKKSSLKNYITLLEAAADSATYARDYWMREYERRVEELLEADNEIAELKADAAANARGYWMRQHELMDERNYWMRQHERRVEELLEAGNKIAELKRRLADNGGLCTLRAKLTTETCEETLARLREDNERLRRHFSDCTEHNHSFERDHNDTQA